MFGIVIDKNGYKVEFVTLDENGNVLFYELKDGESVITTDWQIANSMNKPQRVNGEWIDTEPLPPVEPPIIEEDKINVLLLNGSIGVLKFEKKDNIVFVTGNILVANKYTIIGRLPSNLYPKEDVYISGLIIYTNGDILFSNESIGINGFYII